MFKKSKVTHSTIRYYRILVTYHFSRYTHWHRSNMFQLGHFYSANHQMQITNVGSLLNFCHVSQIGSVGETCIHQGVCKQQTMVRSQSKQRFYLDQDHFLLSHWLLGLQNSQQPMTTPLPPAQSQRRAENYTPPASLHLPHGFLIPPLFQH